MKTPRELIIDIQNVSTINTQEGAETILNALIKYRETFTKVIHEDWYRNNAFKLHDLIIQETAENNPQKFEESFTLIVSNLLKHLNENYPRLSKEDAQRECYIMQRLVANKYEIEEKKVLVKSVEIYKIEEEDYEPLARCKIFYPLNDGTFYRAYTTEYFRTNASVIDDTK